MDRFDRTADKKHNNAYLVIILLLIILVSVQIACNRSQAEVLRPENVVQVIEDQMVLEAQRESMEENDSREQGYLEDEPASSAPAAPGERDNTSTQAAGHLKPVGFVNHGSYSATVRAWTYIQLGETEQQTPSAASTVSSANTGSGTWPNTSRYLTLPMGTYTWCIDWDTGEDKDEDGYFDTYHYIHSEPTLLDENDSDELEFAEEVAISAPPSNAPVEKGKCGQPVMENNACAGSDVQINAYTIEARQGNPPDVIAYANAAAQTTPAGIDLSVVGSAGDWYEWKILQSPGDWIQATTSDPYSAIGVQIFGDDTIGYADIFFDGNLIWSGDTSQQQLSDGINFGIYVEATCFTPGAHTMRVEASQPKEGVGGWQGGVPVFFFAYRY